jgi:hypothetical protein
MSPGQAHPLGAAATLGLRFRVVARRWRGLGGVWRLCVPSPLPNPEILDGSKRGLSRLAVCSPCSRP